MPAKKAKKKKPQKRDMNTRNRIFQSLLMYYIAGEGNRKTIHSQKKAHPDIAKLARIRADEEFENSLSELIDLCFKHQKRNLVFTTKNIIHPDSINRIMGTLIDKKLTLEGKQPEQATKNIRICWVDPNATKSD